VANNLIHKEGHLVAHPVGASTGTACGKRLSEATSWRRRCIKSKPIPND
jgi:hypothetical protein